MAQRAQVATAFGPAGQPDPRAGGCIQRYAIEPQEANWQGLGKAMKVSDDGKMAVQDIDLYPQGKGRAHQEFYATQDVIASATQSLAGLRSIYEIRPGAPLPQPRAGTNEAMFRVDVENKVIGNLGQGALTPLNCNENTAALLGLEDIGAEQQARPQLEASLTHRTLFGRERGMNVATNPEQGFNPAASKAHRLATGRRNPQAAERAYAEMSAKKKRRAAEKLGINQYARAGLGGAYGLFGQHPHFAPVLAASGDDEVTLEAHHHDQTIKGPAAGEIPAGDRDNYNPEWYFQMYGSIKHSPTGEVDDQTFYGRHASRPAGQSDPGLMVIAYGKLPSEMPPDATLAERRSLAAGVLVLNREAVNKALGSYKDDALKRQELSASLVLLERDAANLPVEVDAFRGWMLEWAAEIESAMDHLDSLATWRQELSGGGGLEPVEKVAMKALATGRRTLRRAAQLLE